MDNEKMFLVINPGSSSMKFALYHAADELVSFYFETMKGSDSSVVCTVNWAGDRGKSKFNCMSLDVAFDETRVVLATEGLVDDCHPLDAILVRVVATGSAFIKSRIVDDKVMEDLERIKKFNILHVPSVIKAIQDAKVAFPGVTIIAMSDSEALVKPSRRDLKYAISKEASKILGVDLARYGAHGNSHGYIIKQMAKLELPEASGKVNVCHLGSGCSITAFEYGQPVYHSMGLTPLEGLMSSTRTGSIDPTIGALLGEEVGAARAIELMNKQSGLLCAGSEDMRKIIDLADNGAKDAANYLRMFVEGIAGTIGYHAAVMHGVDTVVFTATIGERSHRIRSYIVSYLEQHGFYLGPDMGDLDFSSGYVNVANKKSKSIYVIPTNEAAYMIWRANQMLK